MYSFCYPPQSLTLHWNKMVNSVSGYEPPIRAESPAYQEGICCNLSLPGTMLLFLTKGPLFDDSQTSNNVVSLTVETRLLRIAPSCWRQNRAAARYETWLALCVVRFAHMNCKRCGPHSATPQPEQNVISIPHEDWADFKKKFCSWLLNRNAWKFKQTNQQTRCQTCEVFEKKSKNVITQYLLHGCRWLTAE